MRAIELEIWLWSILTHYLLNFRVIFIYIKYELKIIIEVDSLPIVVMINNGIVILYTNATYSMLGSGYNSNDEFSFV